MNPRLAANAGALTAAALFGASLVAVRVAVQEVPPLSLAVLRFAQGGLLRGRRGGLDLRLAFLGLLNSAEGDSSKPAISSNA